LLGSAAGRRGIVFLDALVVQCCEDLALYVMVIVTFLGRARPGRKVSLVIVT
jgi:hypothetical protein